MRISRISHGLALSLLATLLLMALTAAAASAGFPFVLGTGSTKPAVAIDGTGRQYYVWWNPNTTQIQYAACSGDDGSNCTEAVSLPAHGPSYYPSIAIDPQGRPNVVFETRSNGSYQVFWTRLERDGWLSPTQISNEPYSELPDIAIGPQGRIHVAYQSKENSTGYVYYVENMDGSWQTPVLLEESPSDKPLANFGEVAEDEKNLAAGGQVANGLYPRVAVDQNDRAYIVWNGPSPYGIFYRRQTNKGWSRTIKVASGQKDQTPDVTVAPDGSVGIIWGTYDDFNAAFAVYRKGKQTEYVDDVDGGLAQSLWPRIATDCAGNFQFVFQGKPDPSASWNIYSRRYDVNNNNLTRRTTIVALGAQEQTPAIATTNITAVVWANTSYKTIYGSVSPVACPLP